MSPFVERMLPSGAVRRAVAALFLSLLALPAGAATIGGSTASGLPGSQVAVTFTLNGNGATRSIAAVFSLPAGLSFAGPPTGAVAPLQCTTGGISWTNTGSPIPTNAGACTYMVQIAPAATPGPKAIGLNQASCDNACTLNAATVIVGSAAAAPALSYSPPSGSTITLGGSNSIIGAEATAVVAVTPSGGSGTGAGVTTTLTCNAGGKGFPASQVDLSFEGGTTVVQQVPLACTRFSFQQQGSMNCFENRAGGATVESSYTLICPAGTETSPPSVTLSASPSRLTQSGVVMLDWVPVAAGGCTIDSSEPGTTFTLVSSTRANATVTAGATPRNEVFTVVCESAGLSVSATATVAAGIAAAPVSPPVASASTPAGVVPNGASSKVELSDGARFIAFESAASNLVAGDTNNQPDVFVRNTATGALTRVSTSDSGGQIAGASGEVDISRDGSLIVYTSGTAVAATAGTAAKLIVNGQVCLNNAATNQSQCLSKSPGGVPGNGTSSNPSLSGDGKVVVYTSTSTNLTAAADANGAVADVFATKTTTGETTLLSVTENQQTATAPSSTARVSCNGRNFVFESTFGFAGGSIQPGVKNVWAGSLAAPGKRLVSVGTGGTAANGDSVNAVITDDGRYVAFESAASNLVAGDTNGGRDVFVSDLITGEVRRVSVGSGGAQANNASSNPRWTCDGAYMAFDSAASNLVAGDNNGATDTFVVNVGTGALALMSQSGGASANGSSANAQISPDGTAIAFDSTAPGLDGNGPRDVYAGANPFASENYTGAWFDPAQSGHGLFLTQLPDGRLVAWWFTFDPDGAQAWFGGTGPLVGNTATIDVVRTTGTRFIPFFNSAEVSNTPIGTLTFNFTNCSTGRVDFALDATFRTGSMNLTRLSAPVGVNCTGMVGTKLVSGPGKWDGDTKATEPTVGPIASVTGAWFDPAQGGHGLFLENLGNGQLLAWWFTFGPGGGQAWFGGVGTITDGNHAQIEFVKTRGGRWIPNFDSSQVTNPVLGPATFTFDNCNSGRIDYNLQDGFGQGTMTLVPLLRSVGTSCAD